MDAGGLAQMTYNNFASNGGLGVPSAGFASRGKGAQLKRLNLAAPPRVASISENQESLPTPRTSRSHLLAGLRTAPKTPTAVPASAPYNQSQHQFGLNSSRFASNNMNGYGQQMPQTATGSTFGSTQNLYGLGATQQMYSLPEQVLAPPPISFEGQDNEHMDPAVVAQLVATEMYLQQRQQQLQQQLLELTTRGLQGMNLNNGMRQQQFPATPMTPQMSLYNQQLMNGLSVPQEVPGQPGVYMVYNAMTGQYNYVVDSSYQQTQLANSPPPLTPSYTGSPPKVQTPTFRAEVSPPNELNGYPFPSGRTSPPKKSPSPPADVTPLPPPSANAFRRGHKKVSSLSLNNEIVGEGPKSAIVRPVGFPQTPQTGTFGPGQGRAGEHPIRQPRGPPPFEELKANPTTKHEGSKNFATRQRRRAVHSLVRAGIERRGVRTGSGGSMTPVSETDVVFSLSENDSDSVHSGGSGSLSGKPSIGSLRAAANGAIGSERKELKERSRDRASVDGGYSAGSVSSDEGFGIGGKLVEVRPEEPKSVSGERRRTPLLVLTSAEKRKSTMF